MSVNRKKPIVKERYRYAYREVRDDDEKEETTHCANFFPHEPVDPTGEMSRRNQMLVNQYGKGLYVCPYTLKQFSSKDHLGKCTHVSA